MPKKLENVREPYASMTRAQLVDELDRFSRNYNDMERSRNEYKRELALLEELREKAKGKNQSGLSPRQETIFAANKLLRLLSEHTPVFKRKNEEARLRKAIEILAFEEMNDDKK